jgi:probable phosphoglycerate mutase
MDITHDPFLVKRENAAELYLIRHGDAIPEADEIIPSGVYDNLPLSRIGREQAQALAERLKDYKFDAAYSSPLRRCQETAAPLLTYLGLQPTLVDGLKEIRLIPQLPLPLIKEGDDLAPLSKALREAQAETTRIAAIAGTWDAVTQEEPSKEFRRRVVEALDGIASQHIGQRVLVFAHGGVINVYTAAVLGLEKEFFFPTINTSITIVRSAGKHRVLYVMNDIAHLRSLSNNA